TPIVDDPYDFGRIAAANALSDVYAMGGNPIMALALVGMPLDKLPQDVIARILEGGAAICKEAGIPIAGGHSIDIPEPIYGLVGIGVVNPKHLATNAKAQAGDLLILTKPLGIGILSAALRKGELSNEGYAEMLKWTTTLNKAGAKVAQIDGVHAMTDVTGFGLAGHLLEMCRGSGLQAIVPFFKLPFIEEALKLAQQGISTGASTRNWHSYGEHIRLPEHAQVWQEKLLSDPQTSGGLLIACSPASMPQVQAAIEAVQGQAGTLIGALQAGPPEVKVDL
ncbi:MAG: selenide, water dikinase SelD, partial [Saezia sp.]